MNNLKRNNTFGTPKYEKLIKWNEEHSNILEP